MRIKEAIAAKGMGGYYFDDQAAIKMGAVQDGFIYRGKPVTPGLAPSAKKGEIHLDHAPTGGWTGSWRLCGRTVFRRRRPGTDFWRKTIFPW